jgi:hypothetical protein
MDKSYNFKCGNHLLTSAHVVLGCAIPEVVSVRIEFIKA